MELQKKKLLFHKILYIEDLKQVVISYKVYEMSLREVHKFHMK